MGTRTPLAVIGAAHESVHRRLDPARRRWVSRVLGRRTLEDGLVLGDEVLIGRTVLKKLDLLAACPDHRLIPNPEHPDQPVTKVK